MNVLVMVQGTHGTRAKEKRWKYQWVGTMFFSDGTSDSREVLIAVKMNWCIKYFPQFWLIVVKDILSFILRYRVLPSLYLITMLQMLKTNSLGS